MIRMSQERNGRQANRKVGRITAVLPDCLYSLQLEDGAAVTAHLSMEMRLHSVRLLAGERVSVELSPFDPSRGRIVKRLAKEPGASS